MEPSRIGPIDHLGFAVRSLADSLEFYREALGVTPSEPEEVPAEGVRVVFLPLGETRIELLEPLGDDSPIARFLARRGEGIHHVCLRVASLEASLERVEREGGEVIPPRVRIGAGGRRIAFLHPRSTGGVLLELKEYL